MYVRPEDLANLCAIYEELRIRRLPKVDLEQYFQISMPINSNLPSSIALADAVNCGLIVINGPLCIITDRGYKLSKKQGQCSNEISDQAKDYLLKKVYLDISSRGMDCAKFLLRFQVDTNLGTFVLYRSEKEQIGEIQWLMTLERLGFLQVDPQIARVSSQYLGLINEFLKQVRKGKEQKTGVDTAERIAIGALAEEHAVQYETKRLTKLGYKELCPLIQQISLVDTSAGYDLLSFRGTGRNPDDRIHIEVKGTKKKNVEFIWSENEILVSKGDRKTYWIYIYTQVDIKNKTAKGPIRLNDPIRELKIKGYTLEPIDVRVSKLS
jgi:hypothetical protein